MLASVSDGMWPCFSYDVNQRTSHDLGLRGEVTSAQLSVNVVAGHPSVIMSFA